MTHRTDRGVSTVFDAALAVLLVTGAVVVLSAPPTVVDEGPETDATHVASTLLPATVTVPPPGPARQPIRGSLGTLLVAATSTDTSSWFRDGVRRAGAPLLDTLVAAVNVSAHATGGQSIAIGPTPPPRATVDAAVVTVETPRGPARLVVRTWSR